MGDPSGEVVHSLSAAVDSVQLTNLTTGQAGGWPVEAEIWIDNEHGDSGDVERVLFRVVMPSPPEALVDWLHDNATRHAAWAVRGWVPQEVMPFPAGVRPVIAIPHMTNLVVVADTGGWEVRGEAAARYEGDPLWVSAMDDAQLDALGG